MATEGAAAAAVEAGKKITLKSADGEEFEIDAAVAVESQTIKHMIEDDCAGSAIPVPNVNSKILAKVLGYCKYHVDAAAKQAGDETADKTVSEEVKGWDTEFVKVDQASLFDLILPLHYTGFCGHTFARSPTNR